MFLTSSILLSFSIPLSFLSSANFIAGSIYLWIIHSFGFDAYYHHYQLIWFCLFALYVYDMGIIVSDSDLVYIMRSLLFSVFIISGITKFRILGFDWFREEGQLEYVLLVNRINLEQISLLFDFNLFALKHIRYFELIYNLIMPFEILVFIGLFKYGKQILYMLAFFQIGVFVFMRVSFYEYIPIYLVCMIGQCKSKSE